MKKTITSILLIVLLLTINSTVYGYVDIPSGISRFFYSKGYSYNAPLKVLNVYTSGTPAADNLVTIYNWTDDPSQEWYIISNDDIANVSSDSYRVASVANDNVALNYRQDTNGCTVYYFGSLNYYKDYPIGFESVTGGGYTIWLYYRDFYLGNTGSTNGSQCLWKTEGNNGISADDVWIMFN